MIERLQASLRALANGSSGVDEARGSLLRDDCADSLRLALDCMQGELTRPQRESLVALNLLLEDDDSDRAVVRTAARDALVSLGLSY